MNWKIAASRSVDDVKETAFTEPGPPATDDTTGGDEVMPGVRKVRIKDPAERPSHLELQENGNQPATGEEPAKPPPRQVYHQQPW